MNYSRLIEEAFVAREKSYSPYSNFQVGAALLTFNGDIYHGCNIENSGHTPSNCAERTAFFKALYEGVYNFKAIAVVGGQKGTQEGEFDYISPCGVCRQVMAEFCDEDFVIIMAKSPSEYIKVKFSDLLPYSFTKDDLKK